MEVVPSLSVSDSTWFFSLMPHSEVLARKEGKKDRQGVGEGEREGRRKPTIIMCLPLALVYFI